MKFRVQDLQARIASERAKHKDVFEQAMEAYRTAVVSELNTAIDKLKQGKRIRIASRWPIPEQHLDDFDTVLDMLATTVDTEIELDPAQFKCWVRGQWDWMRSFTANTSSYLSKGAEQAEEI